MADNFLEYHREEYEKRKALWLAKKKHQPKKKITKVEKQRIQRPDDEAL